MHLEEIQLLPPLPPSQKKHSGKYFSVLFKPEIASRTFAACAVYFCVMMTSYFLLSWMPKMLTELGLSQATGISGSLLLNIGGMAGCLLFGFLAPKFGPRCLAAAFMVGLFITAILFSLVPATAVVLLMTSVAVGFCLYTSINTLYVLVPQVFPTTLRSTGTGLAMSVGRIGAVSGPFVAGMLMAKEWSRPGYILVLALPMLVAAFSLIWLRQSSTPTFIDKSAPREDETPSVPVSAELTRH
ncbi:putative niacin/nicotinamide transporter NaiP [compost metagenome]